MITANRHIAQRIEPFAHHTYEHEPFDVPVKIHSALYSRWGAKEDFTNTRKPMMSINCVTAGNAAYRQDGREGTVDAGCVFLAHKGSNQVFATGNAGFLHKRTVLIDGWALPMLLKTTGLAHTDMVRPADPIRVISILRQCYRVLRQKHQGFVLTLSRLGYELLLELARSIAPEHPPEVTRATGYIQRSLTEQITLAGIAAASGVSVRQCNRLFKRHFEQSPVEFVIRQRMALAQEMLTNTGLSIKRIAYEVGYTDPLYFSQMFKKHAGVSPKAFRGQAGL